MRRARLPACDPQPGQRFFAFFDESNSRGGYFLLYRWDGSSWGDPLFVLQSDAGGRVASAESLGGGGEGTGTDDYGIDGVGPDGLLAPDDMLETGSGACAQPMPLITPACSSGLISPPAEHHGGAPLPACWPGETAREHDRAGCDDRCRLNEGLTVTLGGEGKQTAGVPACATREVTTRWPTD